MTGERRRKPRKLVRLPAAIYDADGRKVCNCMLRDISEEGAGLRLNAAGASAAINIPSDLVLWMTPTGNVLRRCRLIWRNGDHLGVQFVSTN